ncbi:MAG: cytochrome [Chthoniobacter sp.]|nr:cytochrome [Chthoniobacter sp.]
MKRWLIAALTLAVIAIATWRFFPRTAAAARDLTVLFTCDVRGRLVPCGCFTGQLGGLTRVATLIGKGPQPGTLKVDIGDAIEGTDDFHQIEYRYIQQAFAAMGYEALNVGHAEARLSAAELRKLKTSSPVPMLSANLIDQSTGAPVFDSHRIVRRGPWRIALVGVLEPLGTDESLGEGLIVEKMEVVLGKLLPSLKSHADFIVLLAFADDAGLRNLAKQFYELDIILGGKVKQPSQDLVRENRSLILATTNQSRALGTLGVTLAAPSRVTPVRGEVVLVSDQISQDDEIAALAATYRDEIRRTALAIDDPATLQQDMVPGVKARAAYAGSASCVACHPSAGKVWQDSSHGHAWQTLVARKADADPNCIGCHSVGFGTPSGYRREFGAAKLTNVGCESCHGPGSQHVAERQAGGAMTTHFRPIGAGDCQKCHHGEFSRPFDWDSFWPAVRHGKENAAPAIRPATQAPAAAPVRPGA